MAAPPRGPRGGRGPRGRGGARGGADRGGRGGGFTSNAGTRNADGNESDSLRPSSSRGRGRGAAFQSNGGRGGIAQVFQNATRQQGARGGKAPRGGGSRPSTPTLGATAGEDVTPAFNKSRAGETPEQRFQRVREERERTRHVGERGLYVPGSSLALTKASGMVGLCQDMCPEYERARRIFQRDVWGPEKVSSSPGRTSFVLY